MAGETIVTVVGNLTADPEIRYTQGGQAVTNLTIASTPRVMKDGKWEDGDALFLRCSVWRTMAENVAESLTRGTRVIAQGKLKQRSFETKDGEKRTVVEMDIESIGPDLRYATAKVNRPDRSVETYTDGGIRRDSEVQEAVRTGGMGYDNPPPF